MQTGIPFLAILLLPSVATAQKISKEILLTGYTYEIDSLKILPFTTISFRDRNITSDHHGHFKVFAIRTDTVFFSKAGYDTLILNLNDASYDVDTLYFDIVMKQRVYHITEARIIPFHSYEEFRTAFIQLHTEDQDTIPIIPNLIVKDPGMDAYSNYKHVIEGLTNEGNGMVFLSTDPDKGIFALLRKLGVIANKKARYCGRDY